jgi:SAM-dependent methyltransferase
MAEGYATARPQVHPRAVTLAQQAMGWRTPFPRALDIGCGSGLSTIALAPIASEVVGVEPVEAMLRYGNRVAPGAHFVAGAAEQMPFAPATFDLLAAAGSLNYVDRTRFLPEARRVLREGGALLVYDFSPGRSFQNGGGLDGWYAEFERRYPPPAGEATPLDPLRLQEWATGFQMTGSAPFAIALPSTPERYLNYVMTETSVAAAIRRGAGESAIREWCQQTLAAIWPEGQREIVFRGYWAVLAIR